MNRPKDPTELQALDAFEQYKKTPNVLHDLHSFIEGYKAAIKASNETVNPSSDVSHTEEFNTRQNHLNANTPV